MKAFLLAFALLFTLGACDTIKSATTAADIAATKVDMTEVTRAAYAARAAYAGYALAAAEYNELPRCTLPAAPPLCSRQGVVNMLRDGMRKAGPATKAAVDTVRTVGVNPSIAAIAVTTSQNAVAAFKKIVDDNKVGG